MNTVIDTLILNMTQHEAETPQAQAFFAACMVLADYAAMSGVEVLDKLLKDAGL